MATQDIVIQQGATFTLTIPLNDANNNPLNVSGYTANAAVKPDLYSANLTSIVVFSTALANGSLSLRLEANVKAYMWPGTWVYDAIITNGTTTYRVQEGKADIDPGITGISYPAVANTEW